MKTSILCLNSEEQASNAVEKVQQASCSDSLLNQIIFGPCEVDGILTKKAPEDFEDRLPERPPTTLGELKPRLNLML